MFIALDVVGKCFLQRRQQGVDDEIPVFRVHVDDHTFVGADR